MPNKLIALARTKEKGKRNSELEGADAVQTELNENVTASLAHTVL